METEIIFWRHDTSPGIRIEEISGGEDKSEKLWKIMALQIFGENGGNRYREIAHLPSGAPLLEDEAQRISVSHTRHFLVVAFLPRTPEADMTAFSLRTALGVDTEKADRVQVIRVADRVLSEEEMKLVTEYAKTLCASGSPDEAAIIKATVLAWTVKEALYKASLHDGLDFRKNLVIKSLPSICDNPVANSPQFGHAEIILPEGNKIDMELFSYLSEGHIVTIAYSPKCAKFHRGKQ